MPGYSINSGVSMHNSSIQQPSTFRRGIHVPVGGTYSKRFYQECKEDNRVPGPGHYERDDFGSRLRSRKCGRGTMGTADRVMYIPSAGAQCFSKRQRSPRPGPGYYRPNDGAVAATNTFEDDLRMQPLKGMTADRIKLKTLQNRINNYVWGKNNIESLNFQQQREINLVSEKEYERWIRQRDTLRGLVEQEDRKVETAHHVRRSLMGISDRPTTVPFANTEERFFDPRQDETSGRPGTLCTATRLGNLSPAMYEVHPKYSTFGYGKLQQAPTFPRDGRPLDEQHLLKFHEGLGPFVSATETHTLGPGQYEPPTDILSSSMGVADDCGNVKSHFMNKNTASYRPMTTSSIKHASNMGLPIPKDKPRDNAIGQHHTRLGTGNKQHPAIAATFGTDSKDALALSRSFAQAESLGRFHTPLTEEDLGNTRGNSTSAPSFIGIAGKKKAKAEAEARDDLKKKFGGTKSRAERIAKVAAAAAAGEHEDEYTRTSLGVAAQSLVVGLPEKERVNTVGLQGTISSIPRLGMTMTQQKGPKFLPGTLHRRQQFEKRRATRRAKENKADVDEVANLDKFDPTIGSRKPPPVDPDAEKKKKRGTSKWGT